MQGDTGDHEACLYLLDEYEITWIKFLMRVNGICWVSVSDSEEGTSLLPNGKSELATCLKTSTLRQVVWHREDGHRCHLPTTDGWGRA